MFKNFKKSGTKKATPKIIKGLYILAITTEKIPPDKLKPIVRMADEMFRAKNSMFSSMMTKHLPPKTRIEIANIQYAGPLMHSPQVMMTNLQTWIQKQYNVNFKPQTDINFFIQGLLDPKGKENFFLYYFDT